MWRDQGVLRGEVSLICTQVLKFIGKCSAVFLQLNPTLKSHSSFMYSQNIFQSAADTDLDKISITIAINMSMLWMAFVIKICAVGL